MLSKACADANFDAFRIKFQMAEEVAKADPIAAASLAVLAQASYLPNGSDAVLSAWPTG